MKGKKVTFDFSHKSAPKAIKITPTQEDRDQALALFLQYDEDLQDAENTLAEIEENGAIPNHLMFYTTKEAQIFFYECEIKRLREWRAYYLDLMD